MAQRIFSDAFFSIGGVDLSDHVKSVTLNYSAQNQDDTVMGDDTISGAGGLKEWGMTVEFVQDYAAAKVDATIFPMVGTTQACILRADNSEGVSATNPNFTGTGLVTDYIPAGGSVGDLLMTTINIVPGGASPTLLRAES
jgi:hypothetical protein